MWPEDFAPDTRDQETQVSMASWLGSANYLYVESISPDCMSIPAGWLCYLAPEVIRELRIHQKGSEDLPFTR